jgi:hypothetical protein
MISSQSTSAHLIRKAQIIDPRLYHHSLSVYPFYCFITFNVRLFDPLLTRSRSNPGGC